MDVKSWVISSLKGFVNYDIDGLRKLLFEVKVLNCPSNQETRNLIEEIMMREFEVKEGESAVWVAFLAEHIDTRSRKHQIFRHLNFAFQSLVKIYKEESEGYRYLDIIKIYSKKLLKEGIKSANMREVLNSLRMLVSACQSNKPPPYSQVIGLYFSINITFRASFNLNNLQHISSLLRVVNSEYSRYPPLQKFAKSQQVEFKYHEGRYHIYEYNIDQAEQCLDYAFTKCDSKSAKNKNIILKYLIPVKALSGKFPTLSLLQKYELEDYADTIKCIKQGNIKEFLNILQINQFKYIQQGILVIMDSLKLLVYRNLFRKVYNIAIKRDNKLPIEIYKKALKIIGIEDMSLLEIEGIFNNLIYNGWLKAIIDSPNKMIYFKTQSPFPKVANNN